MALRNLRYIGDPILNKISRPITQVDNKIKILLDDMIETMKSKEGVGLAAPQIGVLKRVIVIQLSDEDVRYELINPEILEQTGEEILHEGCLSVPDEAHFVKRPTFVKVKALDRNGDLIIVEGTEKLAQALCHEIDHLNGILYVSKIEEEYEEELEEELEED